MVESELELRSSLPGIGSFHLFFFLFFNYVVLISLCLKQPTLEGQGLPYSKMCSFNKLVCFVGRGRCSKRSWISLRHMRLNRSGRSTWCWIRHGRKSLCELRQGSNPDPLKPRVIRQNSALTGLAAFKRALGHFPLWRPLTYEAKKLCQNSIAEIICLIFTLTQKIRERILSFYFFVYKKYTIWSISILKCRIFVVKWCNFKVFDTT